MSDQEVIDFVLSLELGANEAEVRQALQEFKSQLALGDYQGTTML